MRIVSGGFPSKDECNVHGKRRKLAGAGAEAEGTEQKRLSMVSVYPNEDGWLGCCIRGYVYFFLKSFDSFSLLASGVGVLMPFDQRQCQTPYPSPEPKGWWFQLTSALG